MAVDARGFQLSAAPAGSLGAGIQAGQQIRSQFVKGQEQESQIQRQNQFRQLSAIVADPSRSPQERQAAQQQMMGVAPEQAQQQQQQTIANLSARQKEILTSVANDFAVYSGLPSIEAKKAAAQNNKARLIADNKPTDETDEYIAVLESGNVEEINRLESGIIQAGQLMGTLTPSAGADTGGVDFLKEERKTASQDVRSFNNKAREMRGSFTKMEGLAEQAKTGSRGARNAMVVSLARLISPGIVTETEASNLAGGQNSMQAVFQALSGKGFDVKDIQTYVDPFGETFDAEGLLQVGKSVVASSRQPLIDMFENSKGRATRAGMSEKALNTNFTDNPNFAYLQSFGMGGDDLTPEEEKELAELEALEKSK